MSEQLPPPAPGDETQPPAPSEEPGSAGQIEEEPIIEDAGAESFIEQHNPLLSPDFDLEGFVKSLPEGACLCPMCIGLGAVVEDPPFDPHTHICPTCKGYTRVRTGAVTGPDVERPCIDCKGKGYLDNEPSDLLTAPARPEAFTAGEPRDFMGRTPDDPEFDWTRVVATPVESEHVAAVSEPAAV